MPGHVSAACSESEANWNEVKEENHWQQVMTLTKQKREAVKKELALKLEHTCRKWQIDFLLTFFPLWRFLHKHLYAGTVEHSDWRRGLESTLTRHVGIYTYTYRPHLHMQRKSVLNLCTWRKTLILKVETAGHTHTRTHTPGSVLPKFTVQAFLLGYGNSPRRTVKLLPLDSPVSLKSSSPTRAVCGWVVVYLS